MCSASRLLLARCRRDSNAIGCALLPGCASVADGMREHVLPVDRIERSARCYQPFVVEPHPSAPGTRREEFAGVVDRPDSREDVWGFHRPHQRLPLEPRAGRRRKRSQVARAVTARLAPTLKTIRLLVTTRPPAIPPVQSSHADRRVGRPGTYSYPLRWGWTSCGCRFLWPARIAPIDEALAQSRVAPYWTLMVGATSACNEQKALKASTAAGPG